MTSPMTLKTPPRTTFASVFLALTVVVQPITPAMVSTAPVPIMIPPVLMPLLYFR